MRSSTRRKWLVMGWRVAEGSSSQSKPMRFRDGPVPKVKDAKLTAWDVVYALNMAIACLVSYWIITLILSRSVDRPFDLLGGMWAVAATVFVFRETRVHSFSAGV